MREAGGRDGCCTVQQNYPRTIRQYAFFWRAFATRWKEEDSRGGGDQQGAGDAQSLEETGSNSERKLTADSPAMPIIQNTIPDDAPQTSTPSTGTAPKG